MVAAFNADCLSVVPARGTVGASGDLAPLSHLALGLMGEGPMWDPSTGEISPDAGAVLAKHGLTPIKLEAKEGLAMINGTQMMSSIGAECVVRGENLALTADVACALSVEVGGVACLVASFLASLLPSLLACARADSSLFSPPPFLLHLSGAQALRGTPRAFEACIHSVRPHAGQVAVAGRLIQMLTPPSSMWQAHAYEGKVQDAYSLR